MDCEMVWINIIKQYSGYAMRSFGSKNLANSMFHHDLDWFCYPSVIKHGIRKSTIYILFCRPMVKSSTEDVKNHIWLPKGTSPRRYTSVFLLVVVVSGCQTCCETAKRRVRNVARPNCVGQKDLPWFLVDLPLGFHVKQWNSWFANPELWRIDDQPFRHPGQAALASDVTRRVTGFRQNPMCLDSSDGCQARWPSGVIKRGWEIPELNGGSNRKSSITINGGLASAMFDCRRVGIVWTIVILGWFFHGFPYGFHSGSHRCLGTSRGFAHGATTYGGGTFRSEELQRTTGDGWQPGSDPAGRGFLGSLSMFNWLVASNMLYFPYLSMIYGIILPIDFHIFQDGYCTTNQLITIVVPFRKHIISLLGQCWEELRLG